MSSKLEANNNSISTIDQSRSKRSGFFTLSRTTGPIEKDHGDLPLLACCLVTGMIDAATFSNYAVFVGMQTGEGECLYAWSRSDTEAGNTVILGLSTAGLPTNPYAWLTTLVSIGSFLLGARSAFQLSAWFTPRGVASNRLWASSLIFIQGLFIIISAGLATPLNLVPQNPGNTGRNDASDANILQTPLIVSLIPALAFQSGIQIATSRLLGFNELPVNVMTSTYCDLMGDFRLFALNNVKRNRRFAAVVLVLTGSISSAWIMRSAAGLKCVLWLAAGIKLVTGAAMFLFMPPLKQVLP